MITYINDDIVIHWVQNRCPGNLGFDNPTGIGILRDGYIIGGIVFDNWRPQLQTIYLSIALEDKRALTKMLCYNIANYGFNILDNRRIMCLINSNNIPSNRLAKKLGFKLEGVLREASPEGKDINLYGMLKGECKWLEMGNHKE